MYIDKFTLYSLIVILIFIVFYFIFKEEDLKKEVKSLKYSIRVLIDRYEDILKQMVRTDMENKEEE